LRWVAARKSFTTNPAFHGGPVFRSMMTVEPYYGSDVAADAVNNTAGFFIVRPTTRRMGEGEPVFGLWGP